ncbi:MAG: DUF3108 domain-containing protein [Gemmatimonadales bacterium]
MNRFSSVLAGAGLVVAAALAAREVAQAGAPAIRQDSLLPLPFAVGERMEYDVKFGMFRVGRASMEVVRIDTIRGEPVFHVVFTVRARAIFYSLTDSLQSWFSVRDLTSRRFTQDTDDNGTFRVNRYEIHPERGFYVQNGRDTLATTTQPLDDASFFYFARTLPLEVGRTYTLPRYFKPDRNPVTLRVLGRDTVNTPFGRFAAVAVRPTFKSRGLFSEGGQATVWLSDDEYRIPVMIRTRLSVGSLTMNLRDWTRP